MTELARSLSGLQVTTDTTVDFFHDQELRINPDKSDFVIFVRPRAAIPTFTVNIDGTQRESTDVVRYLGVMFDSKGSWGIQKTTALS